MSIFLTDIGEELIRVQILTYLLMRRSMAYLNLLTSQALDS